MKPYGVILTGPILKAAFRPSFLGGSTGKVRKGVMAGTTDGGGGGCVPWITGFGWAACGAGSASESPREATATGVTAGGDGWAAGIAADKSAALTIPFRE